MYGREGEGGWGSVGFRIKAAINELGNGKTLAMSVPQVARGAKDVVE